MNIHFEWPACRLPVQLVRELKLDNAAILDVNSGGFGLHNAHLMNDAVAFYWHMTRPVMMNLCRYSVCRLDDVELAYGSIHPLRESSRIQAGHFKLIMVSRNSFETEESFFKGVFYGRKDGNPGRSIPSVEDILPNGGSYINDLRYFNDVIAAYDKSDDVLKKLEVEYKRFLIWHEQGEGGSIDLAPQGKRILRTDARFEINREKIKKKTLTECIVGRDSLIEKALAELGLEESWSEFFAEEERSDLLHTLSPELNIVKSKYAMPELVFRDIAKIGLDTYY